MRENFESLLNTGEPIDLSNAMLLGRRQSRDTYVHPHDPRWVLKVQCREVPGRERWYERPPNIPSSLEREIAGYSDILIRLGHHADFLARVAGIENTSLGPAVLQENAAWNTTFTVGMRDAILGRVPHEFTKSEFTRLRETYAGVADLFEARGIQNHCMRGENVLLYRRDGDVGLKFFDFKTIVYRQLVSLRFVPFAAASAQRRVVNRIIGQIDTHIATLSD